MGELDDLIYCVVSRKGILGVFVPPVIDPVTRGRKRKAQFSPIPFYSYKSANRICERLSNMTHGTFAVSAYNVRTGAVMRPPSSSVGYDQLGCVLGRKRRRREKEAKRKALTEKARREST